MARLSFEKRALLLRTVEAFSVMYDDWETLSAEETQERIGGGDIMVAGLAHVTGFKEEDIISAAVRQAKKR